MFKVVQKFLKCSCKNVFFRIKSTNCTNEKVYPHIKQRKKGGGKKIKKKKKMSRRTQVAPLVSLNSCERIRPERPRNAIQRLVWIPAGSQYRGGFVAVCDDEGSNPRMALRRYVENFFLLLSPLKIKKELISL